MYDNSLDKDTHKKADHKVEILQQAIISVVRARFPPLTDLAQEKITRITQPDALEMLLVQVALVPDETMARWLLNTLRYHI